MRANEKSGFQVATVFPLSVSKKETVFSRTFATASTESESEILANADGWQPAKASQRNAKSNPNAGHFLLISKAPYLGLRLYYNE
jgi:hypothetical protein